MIVPIIITPPPEPSQRARDLSELIIQLVNDYKIEDPKTNDLDVNQALALASQKLRGEGSATAARILILSALVLGIAVLGIFFAMPGNFNFNRQIVMPMVVGVIIVILAVVVVFTKFRR